MPAMLDIRKELEDARQDAMKAGMQQGMQQGRAESVQETAHRMLSSGLLKETQLAELLGISMEQLQVIKQELH